MSTNNTNPNTTNSTTTEATIMNKKVFNQDRVSTEVSKKELTSDSYVARIINSLRSKDTTEWDIYIPFVGVYMNVSWVEVKKDGEYSKDCTIVMSKDNKAFFDRTWSDIKGIFSWLFDAIKASFQWIYDMSVGKAVAWWNKEEQENKENKEEEKQPKAASMEEAMEEVAKVLKEDAQAQDAPTNPAESAPIDVQPTSVSVEDECPLDRLFDIINGLSPKVAGTKQGKKIARTCKLEGSVKQRITSSYTNLGSFTTSLTSLLKKAGLSVEDIKAINADIKAAY